MNAAGWFPALFQWVPVSTAVKLLAASDGDTDLAEEAMAELAGGGQVRTRARTVVERRRFGGQSTTRHFRKLSPLFWATAEGVWWMGNYSGKLLGKEVAAFGVEVSGPDLARALMGGTVEAEPKRIGRPPGSGSFANADAPFMQKITEMIEAGEARSPNNAVEMMARERRAAGNELPGIGDEKSRIKRLVRRYRKMYPRREKKGAKV